MVAEIDRNVAGYCAFRHGWLEHLDVHPDHQRHGIGAQLLKQAMVLNESLQLWVFQKNAGAIRFYERFGFKTAPIA